MNVRQRITSAYLLIAVLYALYGWLFGPYHNRSLFYHVGAAMVWPLSIFPALGNAVATILIIIVVVLVLVFGRGDRQG